MDSLSKYIFETAGEDWVYGFSDCAPWVLRWVTRASGKTAPLDVYSSRAESLKILREAGGMVPLFARYAGKLELHETSDPIRGDVAVVPMKQALTGLVGAVALGGGNWAAKMSTRSVAIVSVDSIVAWSVPHV